MIASRFVIMVGLSAMLSAPAVAQQPAPGTVHRAGGTDSAIVRLERSAFEALKRKDTPAGSTDECNTS